MNLREPFFLQMGTPSGPKIVPVTLTDLPEDLFEQTGLNSEKSCSSKTPSILRLVPQNNNPPTLAPLKAKLVNDGETKNITASAPQGVICAKTLLFPHASNHINELKKPVALVVSNSTSSGSPILKVSGKLLKHVLSFASDMDI